MGAIDFDALYSGQDGAHLDTQAQPVPEPNTIDFDALFQAQKTEAPVSTPVQVPVAPGTPVVDSTAADVQQKANQAATLAVAASEAVAPGITKAAPSDTESKVLSIEESAAAILKLVPPVSAYSGLVVPAEVATHLVFAFVSLFRHHVATVSKSQ